MSTPRIGSLCSGYGGLDMSALAVLGGSLAWWSDIDPGAQTVMSATGAPGLGDITHADWSTVEPVDVLTAGYPCQPFSVTGHRRGADDPRHLWPHVARAIDALAPPLVVLENVQGHLTLGFSDVLADLAALHYDARWAIIRASDVGAAHQRARLFITARPGPARSGRTEWRAPMNGHANGAHSLTRAHPAGAQRDTLDTLDPFTGWTREEWREYATAIEHWARIIGRAAPEPLEILPGRARRVRASFSEWLMGLPEGHVTGHDLTYEQMTRLVGNGVMPQQGAHALRVLLGGWTLTA